MSGEKYCGDSSQINTNLSINIKILLDSFSTIKVW